MDGTGTRNEALCGMERHVRSDYISVKWVIQLIRRLVPAQLRIRN